MQCPDCQQELSAVGLRGFHLHECLRCYGKWFSRQELKRAQKLVGERLQWLNFDVLSAKREAQSQKPCPECSRTMDRLLYPSSKIAVEQCSFCDGIWLNHGEFAKMLLSIRRAVDSAPASDLAREALFKLATLELRDFLTFTHLLQERIAVEHPSLTALSTAIYWNTPFK